MAKLNPAIAAAVATAITAASANPAVPLSLSPTAQEMVSTAVVDKLAADPVVLNETNSEPWYQSRVTIGALVALVTPLASLLLKQQIDADAQRQVVDLIVAAGPVIGAAIALWGRWGRAKAPVGGAA